MLLAIDSENSMVSEKSEDDIYHHESDSDVGDDE